MKYYQNVRSKILVTVVSSPFLFLGIIIFWISFQFLFIGKFSPVIAHDNISVIPYFLAFTANDMPIASWTPFPATGTDMLATGYANLIYKAAFSLLPSWAAYQILIILHITAGVIGVYGLSRKVMGLDQIAGIFAGFAYGALYLREFFFLTSTAGYLPFTILVLSYLLDDKYSLKCWVGLIIAGFIISHASYASRLIPWPAAAYILWFFLVERRHRFLDWAIIALFTLAIMGARWDEITALLAYGQQSGLAESRGGGTLDFELLQVTNYLVSYFTGPKNFIGGFPLVFLVIFIISFRANQKTQKRGLLLALIGLIGLAYIGACLKVVLVFYFPALKANNFLHVMQNLDFMLAIAGGYGIEYLRKLASGKKNLSGIYAKTITFLPQCFVIFVVVLNLHIKAIYIFDWVSWGNLYQNSENPIFIKLAEKIKTNEGQARVLSLHMRGTLLNSYGLETFAGYHAMTSRRYLAFWKKMTEKWHQRPNREKYFHASRGSLTAILPIPGENGKLSETDGERGIWLKDFANINLISLANGGYLVSRNQLKDKGLILISGTQKSWDSLTRIEKVKKNIKGNFNGDQNIFLYKNPSVLPRAFAADSIKVFDSSDQVLEALSRADRRALAKTAYVKREDFPANISASGMLGRPDVLITEYLPERIKIEISHQNNPSVLIVTNSYSPYWRCKIDGIKTNIFPVDHAFWGVVLPAGAKTIVFDYFPPYKAGAGGH